MSQRLSVTLAFMFLWMFAFFNVERIFPQINLASFVYAWAPLLAVGLLIWKPLRRLPTGVVVGGALVIAIGAKWGLGYPWSWEALPLTFVEAAAIAITVLLSRRVLEQIYEFQHLADQLAFISQGQELPSVADAEAAMNREMQRARRYDRPLAFVALTPDNDSLESQHEIFRREFETKLVFAFAVGQVGQLLVDETKSSDILAYQDGQFFLLLPETNEAQAKMLANRLVRRCREKFGIELSERLGHFPIDEITLGGLFASVADPIVSARKGVTVPSRDLEPAHNPKSHEPSLNPT